MAFSPQFSMWKGGNRHGQSCFSRSNVNVSTKGLGAFSSEWIKMALSNTYRSNFHTQFRMPLFWAKLSKIIMTQAFYLKKWFNLVISLYCNSISKFSKEKYRQVHLPQFPKSKFTWSQRFLVEVTYKQHYSVLKVEKNQNKKTNNYT